MNLLSYINKKYILPQKQNIKERSLERGLAAGLTWAKGKY